MSKHKTFDKTPVFHLAIRQWYEDNTLSMVPDPLKYRVSIDDLMTAKMVVDFLFRDLPAFVTRPNIQATIINLPHSHSVSSQAVIL